MARALQARTRRARGSQFGATEVIKRALEASGNYLRAQMRAWTVIRESIIAPLCSFAGDPVVCKVLIFTPNQQISVLALSRD